GRLTGGAGRASRAVVPPLPQGRPHRPCCGRGRASPPAQTPRPTVRVLPAGEEPHDEHRRRSGDDPRGVHRGLPADLPVPDHVGARRTGQEAEPATLTLLVVLVVATPTPSAALDACGRD